MGVCSCPHLYAEITYHIATQTSLLSSQIEVMLQLLLHWCWFEQVVTLISQNLHRFGIFSPLSLFLSTGDVNSAAEEKKKKGNSIMVDYHIALLLIMKIRFSSAANISSYLKLENL